MAALEQSHSNNKKKNKLYLYRSQDLQLAEREAGKLGLQLNRAKSELISHDPKAVTSMLEAVPDLYSVRLALATLLRSPIGGEVGVDKSISERTRP